MHGSQGKSAGITRFEFLLGASTRAAIAGWLLAPASGAAPSSAAAGRFRGPSLAEGCFVKTTGDGAEIYRHSESGDVLIGKVNEAGRCVLDAMDGRRSVTELAGRVPRPAGKDAAAAATALFLAELGMAGMLAEPFLVNIHAVEVGA